MCRRRINNINMYQIVDPIGSMSFENYSRHQSRNMFHRRDQSNWSNRRSHATFEVPNGFPTLIRRVIKGVSTYLYPSLLALLTSQPRLVMRSSRRHRGCTPVFLLFRRIVWLFKERRARSFPAS
jgi:hypothetical protein